MRHCALAVPYINSISRAVLTEELNPTHAGTCGGSGSVAFIDCLQDDELSLDVNFGVNGLYMHTSTQITEN